ncbi:MAG: VWA domain-containing protein [Clostridia bacterium]|nr:VWA domain-containing protein [Clostridia bacterium]
MGLIPKNIQVSPDFEKSIFTKTEALEGVFEKIGNEKGVDFTKHMAKVRVALDYSGSMRNHYRTGAVDNALERLLPLGLKFDDNGSMELWLFTEKFYEMPEVTYGNCRGYLGKNLPSKWKFPMGGTDYSPVLKEILKTHRKSSSDGIPTYVIFLTDGGCSPNDERKTDNVIKQMANENIFVQFVGIGHDSFSYLHHLDDFKDRSCDNTGFTDINIMGNVSDDELYSQLLEEYSGWVRDWLNNPNRK